MSDKFYINWCPTYPQPPRKTYDTPEQAHKVAEEMAKKQPGDEFHVLECIGTYKAEKPVAPVLVKTERKETKKERETREANLAKEQETLRKWGNTCEPPKPTPVIPNAVIGGLWSPSTPVQAKAFTAPMGYHWISATEYQLGQEVFSASQVPSKDCFIWSRAKVATTQPEHDTWQTLVGGWYYLVQNFPERWSQVTCGKTYYHPTLGKFDAKMGPLYSDYAFGRPKYEGWGEIGERDTVLTAPFTGSWSGNNRCKYLIRERK